MRVSGWLRSSLLRILGVHWSGCPTDGASSHLISLRKPTLCAARSLVPVGETVRGRIAGEQRRRDPIFSRSIWWCRAVQTAVGCGGRHDAVDDGFMGLVSCVSTSFVKSLMYLDTVFHRDGKGFQGAECTMCKALRTPTVQRQLSMTAKCKRVHSHVHSTVLNGSINWPWSGQGACVGRPDYAPRLQTSHEAGTKLGWATK